MRPDLYVQNPDGSVGPKLIIGWGGVHEDIPRVQNEDGTYGALLGDPRNDENLIIAGLHCAHILFYNRVLDEPSEHDLSAALRAARGSGIRYVAFLIAREMTLWHYQWLLVNEHLPQIAGQPMVNDVLEQRQPLLPTAGRGRAFLPIEFGAAAYRFGHSMVRPSYRANFTSGTGDSTNPAANPFFALVFDATERDLQRSDQLTTATTSSAAFLPATLHRLANLLRPWRRTGQEQQEDRHHYLERAVHAPGPGDRAAHGDQPDGPAAAQPATPAHLGAPLGTGHRRRHGRRRPLSRSDLSDIGGVYAPFSVRPHSGTTSWPSQAGRQRPALLDRWADASSPRP